MNMAHEIIDFEVYRFDKEDFNTIMNAFIKNNSLSIEDILECNTSFTSLDDTFSNLALRFFKLGYNTTSLFLTYFKMNEIKHPLYDRDIVVYDFRDMGSKSYSNHEHRVGRVRHYCEKICEEPITNYLNSHLDLKKWVSMYFTYAKISVYYKYSLPKRYYSTLYDMLVDAYPIIVENKLLFDWEWNQFNEKDIDTLNRMLRDYVFVRGAEDFKDPVKDIPRYCNRTYFRKHCSKIHKHIDRKRFSNYYEWCVSAFPEYREFWSESDFNLITNSDGIFFDSIQERSVFEFIKNELTDTVVYIGKNRGGANKYLEYLPQTSYNRIYPDFLVESVKINGKLVKLSKPVYIEYYGLYDKNHKNERFIEYRKRADSKHEALSSNNDIFYIAVYPEDYNNGLIKLKDDFTQIIKTHTLND